MASDESEFPEEIRVSPEIFARRSGRDYVIHFPYHPEAVTSIKRWAKTDWDPVDKIWSMPVDAVDTVRKALDELAEIRQRFPARPKMGRTLVPADTSLGRGSFVNVDGEDVFVTGLGRVFRSRGGRGKAVRYAYHRELTGQERDFLEARTEQEDFSPPELG